MAVPARTNRAALWLRLRATIAAAVLAWPLAAGALTFRTAKVTCPLDGTVFEFQEARSGTQYGMYLDLQPFGPLAAPWPLARCPSNGFVLYKQHFTDEEIARLKPYVESPAYQALHPSHTNYYLAAKLQAFMGEAPDRIARTLLQATWEAQAAALYATYAAEALAAHRQLLEQAALEQRVWLTLQLIAGELERRLGQFEAARARFAPLSDHAAFKGGVYRAVLELQLKLIDARDTRTHEVPQKAR